MYVSYLELVLKPTGVSQWVLLVQLLYGLTEIPGSDLSISIRHCLQYSIMDEDVLLLYWLCVYKEISYIRSYSEHVKV